MAGYSLTIEGSGQSVRASAILTNLTTGAKANYGSYTFNFAKGTYTTDSENAWGAFDQVGAFKKEEPSTEAPTEAPRTTEAPSQTGRDPSIAEGNTYYGKYNNEGVWEWYGHFDENDKWVWEGYWNDQNEFVRY